MRPDAHDYAELQTRLVGAADALAAMTKDVASARQIVEYDSDRRKRALAVAALPFLVAEYSSSAADTSARASDTYAKAMAKLAGEFRTAQEVIAEWEAKKILFETSRSLLSAHKITIANV
jgi:hypothetical protein